MASWMDGLSGMYTLTSQINALKNQATSSGSSGTSTSLPTPEETILSFQQNFSKMLSSLFSSDDDQKKEEENSNPFSSFINTYQQTIPNFQQTTTNSNDLLSNLIGSGQTSNGTLSSNLLTTPDFSSLI